ncbi:MAG: hypothetical protein LBS19_15675 [Clostridiales bacterium]|nr:hypothetical protein [Clostridiales bacterium]
MGNEFFPNYRSKQEHMGDLFIRADLLLCHIAAYGMGTDTKERHNQFLNGDATVAELKAYAREKRDWAFDMFKSLGTIKPARLIEATVITQMLACLCESENEDGQRFKNRVYNGASKFIENKRRLKNTVRNVYELYFGSETVSLAPRTRSLLKDNLPVMALVRGKADAALNGQSRPEPAYSPARSPVQEAQFISLMELCVKESSVMKSSVIEREGHGGKDFSLLIAKRGQEEFPGCWDEKKADEWAGRSMPRLYDGMKALYEGKELKSIEAHQQIRAVIIARCAHLALSSSPPNYKFWNIKDDILELYNRMGFINTGTEERDIESYLLRFMNKSDTQASSPSSGVLNNYKDLFRTAFKETSEQIKALAVHDLVSAVKIEELQRRIDEMAGYIKRSDTEAMKRFVRKLACGSYGYLLGHLYRFAYAYDDLSTGKLRELTLSFFHVLANLGITPSNAEGIDREIPEYGGQDGYIAMPEYASEENRLIFPGWKIYGESAISPMRGGK